ncbi:hypothetical protein [Pseudomonas orientalis]|uniref:hypothetical protein n=1 Tax=Pseudomonas orientalis TaxID=76758 RepID=UPI0013DDF7B9|nr:hypothetical protein [Pseudomonas orientalis]
MSRIEQYIAQWSGDPVALNLIDRKFTLKVDGEFYLSIIRPTSGAVETENSLVNNELSKFRQQVASVHRSQKGVEKEVLTAACNAVEFASRLREIASASG